MKEKLGALLHNPLRSEFGPLNDEQVNRIIESSQMSSYGQDFQFEVRENAEGKYEIVYGHHRLEAFKKVLGLDHKVNIVIRNYTDFQMLQGLSLENLTKQNDAITDIKIFLAMKKFLEKSPPMLATSKQGKRTDLGENHVTAEQVAKALSKSGRIVSAEKVRKGLSIELGLAPDLKAMIDNTSNKDVKDRLPLRIAENIACLEHNEQRDLVKALKISSEQRGTAQEKLIREYKNAPDDQKQAVRKGDLDIALVGVIPGGTLLDKDKFGKLNMDEVLKDISKNLGLVTLSLTDRLVDNIKHASPGEREKFSVMLGCFLTRIKEIRKRLDLQLID